MGFLPDDFISGFRGVNRAGFFLRVGSDEFALRYWWGLTDLEIDETVQGALVPMAGYIGGGILKEVPDSLEVLMNGGADRVEFTLNGITPEAVAQIADAAPNPLGKEVVFGVAPMDELWQPASQIVQVWDGVGEAWSDELVFPSEPGQNATATISLITSSGSPARSSSALSTWTERAQAQRSATDNFFNRISIMYQQRIVRWPTGG